jgi:hypothetical protein
MMTKQERKAARAFWYGYFRTALHMGRTRALWAAYKLQDMQGREASEC